MIQKVWIKHVRNLKEICIDLVGKKHCFIQGANNQGKTSILEAIFMATELKSPIQDDIEKVMQEEKDESIIGIDISEKEPHRRYIRYKRNGKKEMIKNEKIITKKQLQTHFCEYISADALHIFQKDPDFRRKNLDRFCSLVCDEYNDTLKRYEKILKQKNKYLKQETGERTLVKTMNQTLASLGAIILKKRLAMLKVIEEDINKTGRNIAFGKEGITMKYDIKRIEEVDEKTYEEKFLATLEEDYEKEKILKYSLSGPHRDDFYLMINKKKVFEFFSRGINRSYAILFRLAQINIRKVQKKCLCLLLDDTFAEVDDENKKKVLCHIKKHYQVFYATTRKEDVALSQNDQIVMIENGRISYG